MRLQSFVMMTIISLGFISCNSKTTDKAKNENPVKNESQTPITTADTNAKEEIGDQAPETTPVMTSSETTENLAAEAFFKTKVSGKKKWNLTNVTLEYLRSKNYQKIENLSAKCIQESPAILNGTFPKVSFSLQSLVCATPRKLPELAGLLRFTGNMEYKAKHMPALPEKPNQFMLHLLNPTSNWYRKWVPTTLNARADEKDFLLDVIGREQSPLGASHDSNHFMEVSISEIKDGRADELKISYSLYHYLTGEEVNLTIKAELELVY